jgi:CPA2 family monovalent cation:H+ antiporter-2
MLLPELPVVRRLMHTLLPILIATIAMATVLNVFLKRHNVPTVIGYIVTGAIVGAIFDVHVHDNPDLEHLAEFGVVFLMFTIGLEFSVEHLKSMRREVFLFGLLQVALTGALISVIANVLFDVPYRHGVLVGAGLALSSTAIVLKILNESGQIKSPFGRNALGILIFQDIAVIPILLMITIVTSGQSDLWPLLRKTGLNAVMALGILILVGRFALGRIFRTVSNANSKEIYMGSILMTVIGGAYVAHAFGFSYSLGAFIAGMMIADTIYRYQVEADLIPFRDLLLGVFFVTVGLSIDLRVVVENIIPVVLLGLGVMALKMVITTLILLPTNGRKIALKTAITICQMGEFSLVVFSLLLASHVLDPTAVQIIIVTVILSMIATPFLISKADRISTFLAREKLAHEPVTPSTLVDGHVILCGYGAFGKTVSDHLDDADVRHIVITDNTDDYVTSKKSGKTTVFGDPADRVLLERLNIMKAMGTVIALDDFEKIKQVSAALTLLDPELKVITQVPTEQQKSELAEFNQELLLDGNSHLASVLVDQIKKSRTLATETSSLQYLHDDSMADPERAIDLVTREQSRLLDIISRTFNGLREGKDILHIKALHDSFGVLSEIIGHAINRVMNETALAPSQYERVNVLLDNQGLLRSMNDLLSTLAGELKDMEATERTRAFALSVVEALDAILLSLKDIARECTDEDLMLLRNMTSGDGKGFARIRQSYLGTESKLDPADRAKFLSATNNVDRLRQLFGGLGENYEKLARTQ